MLQTAQQASRIWGGEHTIPLSPSSSFFLAFLVSFVCIRGAVQAVREPSGVWQGMVATGSDVQDEQGEVKCAKGGHGEQSREAVNLAVGRRRQAHMGAGGAIGRGRAGSPAWNRFPVMVGPQPNLASLSVRPALWPQHQVCHVGTYLQHIVITWLLP